jgi:MFS transporter, SP family, general alpha glucoside:H+ symporter
MQLPGGRIRFVPLLLAKVKELLPDFLQVLCDAIQLPVPSMNSPMSPDTLFIYEDEVGKSLYADLRRGEGKHSGAKS